MDGLSETIQTIEKMVACGRIKNPLTSLTIHTMRRFQPETKISFLFPLTVLVGKNGSGKTTIMKLIQTLANCNNPEEIFFETVMDDGGMKNASFSFQFDEDEVICTRRALNKWHIEGQAPKTLKLFCLNPKTLIGAFEKSFLYDDVGKNPKKKQKVEYVIRQSKKIFQNKLGESRKKIERLLSPDTVELVNEVLQLNLSEIRVVEHKYFSGTWATNVLFSDGTRYSEYNAGSGEFLVSLMLDYISKLPDNSLLLIDEPEVSLHPGAQRRFVCYLLETIKKKKLQIIMTTHSASVVENLPPKAIVCLRRFDHLITAEENLNYQYAFAEIEEVIFKKHIVVEDTLAKCIIDGVLKEESLDSYIQVDYYPGGADNLKTHTILTYAKTHISNRFIVFDGDQKPSEAIPDFSEVLEKEKNMQYYENIFKQTVHIRPDTIVWGVDANKKSGRKNESQAKQLLIDYLEFYKNNVKFLPKKLPEDLIIDLEKLRVICDNLPQVEDVSDSKAKLKIIADETGYPYSSLISILTTSFVKKKDENYQQIVSMLRTIAEI